VEPIFHIAEAAEWDEAFAEGEYRKSTLGYTLDQAGFIHCSRRDQLEAVANAVYGDRYDLVLLLIDREKVHAEIRDENLEGGSELFPHIYGPLNLDAVMSVLPFAPGVDGRFAGPL
jgi:glutathione S-transferase